MLAALSTADDVAAFAAPTRKTRTLFQLFHAKPSSNDSNQDDNSISMNPFTKASWYGVELFGKAFGSRRQSEDSRMSTTSIDMARPPQSLQETLKRLELDSERSYFVSGQVDGLIYDEDCIFADPFVSFAGRQRFVDNLQNLGSFITQYNVKTMMQPTVRESDESSEDDSIVVDTKYMVKLELNLPWKPILAWPWGVEYMLDPSTFLVTKHRESWDIEPLEGVKQIFRKPTLKL
jgi:hypothetical protein